MVARSRLSFALVAAALLASGCADESESAAPPVVTRSIAVSATHGCALRQAGLFCWGQNFAGQLGNGNVEDSPAPVQATAAGDSIVEVAASTGRTCVRQSGGEVACWGKNDRGQVGDGTRDEAHSLTGATGIDDAVQLAIDDFSTCVLRETGRVACWGGARENEPEQGSLLPEFVDGLENVVELRGGIVDTYCALDGNGEVSCFRFAGDGYDALAPTPLPALAGASTIAVTGHNEVCAIAEAGNVVCHNLESGSTIPLVESEASIELVSSTLVTCALGDHAQWTCWNILPQMLETIGSPALHVPNETPIVELVIGGFQVCVRYDDDRIACAQAGNVTTPELNIVEGLPL